MLVPVPANTNLSAEQEREVTLNFNAGNMSASELTDVIKHIYEANNILKQTNQLSLIKIVIGHSIVAWMRCRCRPAVQQLCQMVADGFLQKLLAAILRRISGVNDVEVSLKVTPRMLQWADDYILNSGNVNNFFSKFKFGVFNSAITIIMVIVTRL